MNIIVQKFGGTSLGDIARIKRAAQIIKANCVDGSALIAVVSAMAGATNNISALVNEVSPLTSLHALAEHDTSLASGEIITASLLALELQNIGVRAKSLQGWQVPIYTDAQYGNAQITEVGIEKIKQLLDQGIMPVITGFQGASRDHNVTTLGRGGSDTSAAVIAAALQAIRCDIYTDVLGIYTADPRIVHNAKKIDHIDSKQLYELCSHGARVLHPRAALAAIRYDLNLRILSSFEDDQDNGTIITKNTDIMEHAQITAITSNKNLLNIIVTCLQSNHSQILQSLLADNILISNSASKQGELQITTEIFYSNRCKDILTKLKSDGIINNFIENVSVSSISVIGFGLKNHSNIIIEILRLLKEQDIINYGMEITDLRISFNLDDENIEKAIKLIHDHYF